MSAYLTIMTYIDEYLRKNGFGFLSKTSTGSSKITSVYTYEKTNLESETRRRLDKLFFVIKISNSDATQEIEFNLNEVTNIDTESQFNKKKLNEDLNMVIDNLKKEIPNKSDHPPPDINQSGNFPLLPSSQFVDDIWEPKPLPSHNPHMDNLLDPRPSPLARGMMFTQNPSTQMMSSMYSPHTHRINNPQNPNSSSSVICGSCYKQVQDNEETAFCELGCKSFYHRTCVGFTEQAFKMLNQENGAKWVCDKCVAEKRVLPVILKE